MKLKMTLIWEYDTGTDDDTMNAYGTLDPEGIVKFDQETLDTDLLFMVETMDPKGLVTSKIEAVSEIEPEKKEKEITAPVAPGTLVQYHGSMQQFHGRFRVVNAFRDDGKMSIDGFRYWLIPDHKDARDYIWNVRRQSFTIIETG